MNAPLAKAREAYVTRFSSRQRVEHFVVMTLFTLLTITGMPQKYFLVGFSASVVKLFGGIHSTRIIHRVCGFAFSAVLLWHLWGAIELLVRRKMKVMTMVPARKDVTDAIGTLRYYLGLSKEHPKFDRYDYRQKFEYWGMVAGSLIMVATGLILFFPTWVARVMPGEVIPAAKVAHSNEGLMAMLVVVVWHIYNAHLNPDVFPFDTSIFTGKISRHRMEHEHPLELERIDAERAAPPVPQAAPQGPPAAPPEKEKAPPGTSLGGA